MEPQTPNGNLTNRIAALLVQSLVGLSLVVLIAIGLLMVALHTQWVTQKLVPYLPGVKVSEPSGGLLGEFRAKQVLIDLPRGSFVRLDDAQLKDLHVFIDPAARWYFGVGAKELAAKVVEVKWVANPKPEPSGDPKDLRLPLTIYVDQIRVGEGRSHLWGAVPLKGLDGRLRMRQGFHSADIAHLQYGQWSFKGRGQLATTGKLAVDADVHATGEYQTGQRIQAIDGRILAKGRLTAMDLHVQVHSGAGSDKQSLDAKGQLTAWASWPITSLVLRADRFDANLLSPDLPRTLIGGTASLKEDKGVLGVRLDLTNSVSGPWDRDLVPSRGVKGSANIELDVAGASFLSRVRRGDVDIVSLLGSSPGSRMGLKGRWGTAQSGEVTSNALALNFEDADLRRVHTAAPALTLSGQISANAAGKQALAKSWQALSWQLTAQLQGLFQQERNGQRKLLPVSAVGRGAWRTGLVDVTQLTLSAGQAQAELSGKAQYTEAFKKWSSQFDLKLAQFDPRVWLPWPQAWSGANSLQGHIQADINSQWQVQASVNLSNSLLSGVPVNTQLSIDAPRDLLRLKGQLELGGNQLFAEGSAPWRRGGDGRPDWRGPQDWSVKVHGGQLQTLAGLMQAFGVQGLGGQLDLDAHYAGRGADVDTQGRLVAKGLKGAWGQAPQAYALGGVDANWNLSSTRPDAPFELKVILSDWASQIVRVGKAELKTTGGVSQHNIDLSVNGEVKVSADQRTNKFMPLALGVELSGGMKGELLDLNGWAGRVQALNLHRTQADARTLLVAQPFEIDWLRVAGGHQLKMKQANLEVGGVPVHLQGWSWVFGPAAPVALQGQLELPPLNLAKLLRQWQPETGWGGDLKVGGRMAIFHTAEQPWQVDAMLEKVSGDLTLSDETIEGSVTQPLGIDRTQVSLSARNGLWVLTQRFEGQIFGSLMARQSVQAKDPSQLPGPDDALSGAIDVRVDSLRPWAAWVPPGWRLNGKAIGHADLSGTLAHPQYQGELSGQALQISNALLGVNLTDGRMLLALKGSQAELKEFTAKDGRQGGVLSATGQARFDGAPVLDLQVKAERFALLQRFDRRLWVSGQATAALREESIDVSGRFKVDEGLFDFSRSDAPTIGEDVNVVNGPGARTEGEDTGNESESSPRKVRVAVEVALGEQLHLKGRGLETHLAGVIRFSTPNNKPALHGTVKAVDGTYAAYGQKLRVERGTITFNGLIENPRLDILAMRAQSPLAASSDVKVGVAITGTAQDPRIALYSEPAMSETEKLSWLILGREPSGLGGADIGLLQSAAVALLSGEGPSTTDNIITSLGLDELSVRQSDGTVRETVVNVGKQLSRRWYVGYERNLNATSGNWQLIYRLAQRFTLRAQTGVDNAVDLIWSWRWD